MNNSLNNTNHPMTSNERIFHAILFELGAIVISVLIIKLSDSYHISTTFGLSVIMSIMAMVWNVIFNYFFDKIFIGERLNRGVLIRLLHVLLFEGGLLLFTAPVIAYALNIFYQTHLLWILVYQLPLVFMRLFIIGFMILCVISF